MSRIYSKWSLDAILCDDIKQDCNNCPVYKINGFHKDYEDNKRCHIPQAIEILNNSGISRKKISGVVNPKGVIKKQ